MISLMYLVSHESHFLFKLKKQYMNFKSAFSDFPIEFQILYGMG
jgi:hypothetical protein